MRREGYEGEFLSEQDILNIHTAILKESGTVAILDNGRFIDPSGGTFKSAVNSIFAGFGGYDRYQSIVDKSSALCYNIISSHVFRDANKRTGSVVLLRMLEKNGYGLDITDEELANLVIQIAEKKISYEDFNEIVNKKVMTLKNIKDNQK